MTVLASAGYPVTKDGPTTAVGLREYVRLYGKQEMLMGYSEYFDRWVERSRLRDGVAALKALPAAPSVMSASELDDQLWATHLSSANTEQTQNSFLVLALALHAYMLERGGYPADLATLVPDYVAQVPEDAFACSGPLQYQRASENSYLLYSVGPSGANGEGVPIKLKGLSASFRRLPDNQYLSDIVAGVNF